MSQRSRQLRSQRRRQLRLAIGLLAVAGVIGCAAGARARVPRDPAARSEADALRLAPYLAALGEPVYSAEEVDRPARLLEPLDPPLGVMAQAVEACNLPEFEFVVDTSGRPVVAAPIRLVRTTTPGFADAVRRAIPERRYRPAERGGRKVAQLVLEGAAMVRMAGGHPPGAGTPSPRCTR